MGSTSAVLSHCYQNFLLHHIRGLPDTVIVYTNTQNDTVKKTKYFQNATEKINKDNCIPS